MAAATGNKAVKNFRDGKLLLLSGDTPDPLCKEAELTDGDFNWEKARNLNVLRNRGLNVDVTEGDDPVITFSFSFLYTDKTLFETLDQKIWEAIADAFVGLAAGANQTIATTFEYVSGTLQVTDAGFIKVAGVPAVAGEFSEGTPAAPNQDEVIGVTDFQVFMPAGDVDLNVIYDALGKTTQTAISKAGCSNVPALKLKFELINPCDNTVIDETVELDKSYIEVTGFEEGEEADKMSITGFALIKRPIFT